MDEIVLRSMLKWPDVPAVYGWLSLDRRGSWMIKTVAGRFERIAHAAVREFIGRNYASDPEGRWFFQNGPQRVFVALDYTPWVYRLDDAGQGLLAHTGAVPRALEGVFLDDAGALLLKTEIGIGVLLDRDLPGFLERLADVGGRGLEGLLEEVARGAVTQAILQGRKVPIASVRSADVPSRFGFVARPAPRAGEPEC
ncbi:MAG: DUF2946 family protein [Betaproteobacteria bacterium]|nr:MAG: DUF2946 family protein [Betaproteobacteria bacterium]TMH83657.1 MAG: DUF2946 family protein [Betaproteobacteria bacterium]